MQITATLINIFNVCPRECWLHANGITMEHTSDVVYEGKVLHETSYAQRASQFKEMLISTKWQDIDLFGQIDYFDVKKHVVYETKKSNKVEDAHTLQLKFYLWLLYLSGVKDVSGILEYPKLRKTTEIYLSKVDIEVLEALTLDIVKLINQDKCPEIKKTKICRSCSYNDFCYAGEEVDK